MKISKVSQVYVLNTFYENLVFLETLINVFKQSLELYGKLTLLQNGTVNFIYTFNTYLAQFILSVICLMYSFLICK